MKGIHVFQKVTENFSEHVLLIQAISAIEWRKNNGPIHLYTTSDLIPDLEKMGLTYFYDEINTEVLDEKDDIPWDHFYPATKIKVLRSIKEFPVAFIDTDFIYWDKLDPIVNNYDITYMHREGLFWRNYPPLEFLGRREDYQFPDIKTLENSRPINVGFFIMNNQKLRDEYVNTAYEYMRDNSYECKEVEWASFELRRFWKSLFVEQRLLGAIVDKNRFTNKQIFPYDYYGDTLSWEDLSTKSQLTQDEINLEKIPFFHLWGEKSSYSKPEGKMNMILKFYELASYFLNSKNEFLESYATNIMGYLVYLAKKEGEPSPYKILKYLKIKSKENESSN